MNASALEMEWQRCCKAAEQSGLCFHGCVLFERRSGTFQFAPDCGELAVVIPIRMAAPSWGIESFLPQSTLRWGYIVDIVAYTDSKIGLRLGVADVLGRIEPQLGDCAPVPVWRHPSRWRESGGEGLVLLGGNAEAHRTALLQCRAIQAEDVEHGDELARLLRRPYRGLPEIFVRPWAA